jgi:hypothetical protein
LKIGGLNENLKRLGGGIVLLLLIAILGMVVGFVVGNPVSFSIAGNLWIGLLIIAWLLGLLAPEVLKMLKLNFL